MFLDTKLVMQSQHSLHQLRKTAARTWLSQHIRNTCGTLVNGNNIVVQHNTVKSKITKYNMFLSIIKTVPSTKQKSDGQAGMWQLGQLIIF